MNLLLHALDLFGTAVFAVTGALVAGRKQMDIFGVVVLGCVTALGGGTLRDFILGNYPVFWLLDIRYLGVAVSATICTFVLARRWKLPKKTLLYADAVGLSVFTVIGYRVGFQATGMYTASMVTGVTTGVVGGMIRDVLSGEMPLILRKEVYASASLSGAALMALLYYLRFPELLAVSLALLVTLGIRIAALRWHFALPNLRLKADR